MGAAWLDVCYASDSDQILHRTEMARCARSGLNAAQHPAIGGIRARIGVVHARNQGGLGRPPPKPRHKPAKEYKVVR